MKIDVNGIGIHVEVTGEGAPVILLHGFPDTGRLWRNQVPALVAAGHQVIVPDLRGYGESDKPTDVEQYGLLHLAGDVLGVLDHLGVERAAVVGHDWGAALAWVTTAFAADRVERLVALAVGHPGAFAAAGLRQREMSWYMLLFQFEGIAESWLSDNDWANLRAWATHPDGEAVIAELERSGSLTPGLNYYRANVAPESLIAPPPEFPQIQCPTMGVWGSDEFALTEAQMTGSAAFVDAPFRYERIEGAGHWLPLEAPDRVNELLVEFLA